MAPQTSINSTSEQLVLSLAPKSTAAPKLRKLKDTFSRRLKHHNFVRTNQFEVIERFDGLEEKFQVLNRDDLSDALHGRRTELKKHDESFLPDVLDLLLRLSVDPTNTTPSDELESVQSNQIALAPLNWADIEKLDPIDHDDPIWQIPDYNDFGSDEERPLVSTGNSSAQGFPQTWRVETTDSLTSLSARFEDEQQALPSPEMEDLFPFWARDETGVTTVTELQLTREILFMLQGFPTTLYSNAGGIHEARERLKVTRLNDDLLHEVLASFSEVGRYVDVVRSWLKQPRAAAYMQTMRDSVESYVLQFNKRISDLQNDFVHLKNSSPTGLLPSLELARQHSSGMITISRCIQTAEVGHVDAVGYLDIIFEHVSAHQSAGELDQASILLALLIPSLKVYLKPISHWMQYGKVHAGLEPCFVVSSGQHRDPSVLWQNWFSLNDAANSTRTPQFLKPFMSEIFAIGKTTLFLRYLGQNSFDRSLEVEFNSALESIRCSVYSEYLTFSETSASAFKSILDSLLRRSSAALYQEIDQQCGLWSTLDVLECIYFGRRGPTTDNIDTALFRRIDKCDESWVDRFLVVDLLRSAFVNIQGLDVGRITVQSSHMSSRSMEDRRRSVRILGDLSIDYNLPWQIANIIPQSSFVSYRRVALLLTQTRRARYSLERRARFYVMNARLGSDLEEQKICCGLFQKLLLFVNILYNHLTSLVVENSASAIQKEMRKASNIDQMTSVHKAYLRSLEKACLTAKTLTPIRDATISILDLCIRFSDIMTPVPTRRQSDVETSSFKSARSRPTRRKDEFSSEKEESSDEEEVEGYSTFALLEEAPVKEFIKIGAQLDHQLAFVVAGLRSLARVEEDSSWSILADRLDWRRNVSPPHLGFKAEAQFRGK